MNFLRFLIQCGVVFNYFNELIRKIAEKMSSCLSEKGADSINVR